MKIFERHGLTFSKISSSRLNLILNKVHCTCSPPFNCGVSFLMYDSHFGIFLFRVVLHVDGRNVPLFMLQDVISVIYEFCNTHY